MTHEEALELLHDFHRGKLEGRSRDELESHLASCEECRASSRTCEALYAWVRMEPVDQRSEHPSSEQIVAYAVDRGRLAPEAVSHIVGHLESCAACSEQVERALNVNESIRRRPGPIREIRHPRAAWGALAAAVLLIALAYPAFLGLFRLPAITKQLQAERARLENWSGVADLNVLSSSQRQGEAVATVRIDPDQPYAAIAVQPFLPSRVADGEQVRFEIDRDDGTTVWTEDLEASKVRDDIKAWGVVTLLIPAARLEPGRYGLRLRRPAIPDERPLLRVRFEVIPKP